MPAGTGSPCENRDGCYRPVTFAGLAHHPSRGALMSEPLARLLLDVWRQASQQTDAAGALERVFALLCPRLPPARLFVRRFDLPRGLVETVAGSADRSRPAPEPTRSECSSPEMQRLLLWCR